ncbi:hypothetical protein LZ757_04050 [Xylella fastidiosa subsp. morus]|nr:hypothetical protein [Xylella fastidiosa]UIN28667.1 hypothetical protein IUD23_04035 [Xylella fastidiosa subsp. morus]UIT37408.1 hypothetical protein LZ757_04050 [Xylella fastidiosa subsp. morus]UIT39702.1 hypothetical protein LZ755_04050 [Xylella fastidiosa subsp. morus]UIT44143.1 hypothetical protein LZ758_04040 [Xylella fastidiosa subsp. morus]
MVLKTPLHSTTSLLASLPTATGPSDRITTHPGAPPTPSQHTTTPQPHND